MYFQERLSEIACGKMLHPLKSMKNYRELVKLWIIKKYGAHKQYLDFEFKSALAKILVR